MRRLKVHAVSRLLIYNDSTFLSCPYSCATLPGLIQEQALLPTIQVYAMQLDTHVITVLSHRFASLFRAEVSWLLGFITARIYTRPRSSALMAHAPPRLPQLANLPRQTMTHPRSSAPQTGTSPTRTTARSSTSVSGERTQLTLARQTSCTATRRHHAYARRAAQTAQSSSANTRFCLSTLFIPRIRTCTASVYGISRL
jgi:hypothetical protein